VICKLESVQVLRGLAALGVVAFHLTAVDEKFTGGTLLPGCAGLGQCGVDLFFVISGFVMTLITSDHWGELKSAHFLLRRVSRIFPVYWFYSLVTLCAILAFPGHISATQQDKLGFVNIFNSFFLIPSETVYLVIVAWSLMFEVYFYILFSGLIRFPKKTLYFFVASWAGLLVAFNAFFPLPGNDFLQLLVHPYSLEFLSGIGCCLLYKKTSGKQMKKSALVVLSLTACFGVCSLWTLLRNQILLQTLTLGCLFALLIFSVASLERMGAFHCPCLFVKIGDASYSIYLSHILIIGAMEHFAAPFFFSAHSKSLEYLFFAVTLILILAFSRISYRYIERPSYAFLNERIVDRYFRKYKANIP
jgi:peptidoglycan/LPS O-acetylase OafA/YrhL